MKICKNCNKAFTDDKLFCNECGSALSMVPVADIFGDPMEDNRKSTIVEHKELENETGNYYKTLKSKKLEIITICSLLLMLIPLYGTAYDIFSVVFSYKHYSEDKTKKLYFIISVCALVLSIIWFMILVFFNVLDLGTTTNLENV